MMNATQNPAQGEPTPVVRFLKNWNNKLTGDYFTSIRLRGEKYRRGNTLKLLLWERGIYRTLGQVRVVEAKPLRLHQITPYISYLDAGMDVDRTKEMLYHMYRERVPDVNQADFVLVLFERVRGGQTQGRLF
jgi:hypothetical protein